MYEIQMRHDLGSKTQRRGSGTPLVLPLWLQAHGNTALHMAAALPPGPPQEAIVRHLLAAGADPTLRNLENEQPVHLLRPGPGPEGLRQLLKRSRTAPPGLSS